MSLIEKMLIGEMPMKEFLHLLSTDIKIQQELNNIIPKDAIWNPDHALWKKIAYSYLFEYDFDLYKGIAARDKFDDHIRSNVNIWGTIKAIYSYAHPNLPYTTKYMDLCMLYINVVGEAYEGDDEIRFFIEEIILSAISASPKKSEQKRIAKEAVRKAIHVEDAKKYPRWIQGAEWPMGENSPMVYVRRENHGEEVHYFFRDFDTGEERTVIQFY